MRLTEMSGAQSNRHRKIAVLEISTARELDSLQETVTPPPLMISEASTLCSILTLANV